jgi:anaerobic selenocysteine-containing dehydrogenase
MPGKVVLSNTLGASMGMDMERFVDSKLIILWGSNPITSSLHLWSRVVEAKRRGAKVIAIDPYRSLSAQKCDQHVALLPGTDAALALGLMHVLIRDDLIDRDYIDRYTLGFDGLAARAAEWPPERVAQTCGIDAAVVEQLAHDYGTIKPAAIRLNYGMQRTAGGGMAMRTAACLPALIGAWRDPAGGALLSSAGTFPIDRAALERPDFIPKGTRTINMSTIGNALTSLDRPVKAMVVYNTNPVAVAPESEKVIAGFSREDLFTVVLEHFKTDTADYADILLPATTQLEHVDIHGAYGHIYWTYNNPAIAPLGEAKANSEIFRLLAARMGFDDPCFGDSDEDLARAAIQAGHPNNAAVDFETLKEAGWVRVTVPETYAPFAEGNFPTPSGKCEFYSERLLQLGFDPLPAYHPPNESAATSPELAQRYPLAMISPPTRNFLNSSFANIPSLKTIDTGQRIELHPDDAKSRGIRDGDRVRAFNDRGAFEATARVTDAVRPGLAVGLGIWWHKFTPAGRNVNAVTSQKLTDFGNGPTFYDCLVEVERV